MKQPPLSGRYELQEVVGTGGMSVVYAAWDLTHNCRVAVKVLRAELAADADFVRRFDQEAQAASRMSHANIVAMLDVGQDGEIRYLVMEYVQGQTLKDLIRQKGQIPPQQAVQMALRILAAIDHAHKNHIIHRDIKPQNILVTDDGVIKVADFGIARATNQATQTRFEGNVLGSVHYFSPEQASGEVADEKSDLYSVGIVFYEMVTGRVPFDGETAVSVAYMHVNEPPVSPRELNPEVSVGLAQVILKSLEKSTARRYQTAADMATDLKNALRMPEGGFIPQSPEEIAAENEKKRLKQRIKKRRMRMMIAAITLIVLAVGIVQGSIWYNRVINTVTTPTVVNLDREEAVRRVEAARMNWFIEEQFHAQIAKGIVVAQDPAGGSKGERGATVYLTVSLGKEPVVMPDLTGMAASQAKRTLEQFGFTNVTMELAISDEPTGHVIDQSPLPDLFVVPGEPVLLTVSGESRPMPDLFGQTVDEARATLRSAGFSLGQVTDEIHEAPGGTIIGQTIEQGDETLLGTVVNVKISKIVPITYYAEVSFTVTVRRDGDVIRCILDEGGAHEQEVFSEVKDAGKHTIKLQLESEQEGELVLSVYVGGDLKTEKKAKFKSQ